MQAQRKQAQMEEALRDALQENAGETPALQKEISRI